MGRSPGRGPSLPLASFEPSPVHRGQHTHTFLSGAGGQCASGPLARQTLELIEISGTKQVWLWVWGANVPFQYAGCSPLPAIELSIYTICRPIKREMQFHSYR